MADKEKLKEAIKMLSLPLAWFLELELDKCLKYGEECDSATKYLLQEYLEIMVGIGEISPDEIEKLLKKRKTKRKKSHKNS